MKLSLITPYYKTFEYTEKLAKSLEPQLSDDVEWIIVDDGCNDTRLDNFKAKVIHLTENSGNASVPRNIGLSNSKGEYIAFIDSDDNVKSNYVNKILEKINEGFDYCYISWESTNGFVIIIEDEPPIWNNSVWKCVYRKEKIKNLTFNPNYNYGEDLMFNKKLENGSKTSIIEPIYIYTVLREGSLTELYKNGKIDYKK